MADQEDPVSSLIEEFRKMSFRHLEEKNKLLSQFTTRARHDPPTPTDPQANTDQLNKVKRIIEEEATTTKDIVKVIEGIIGVGLRDSAISCTSGLSNFSGSTDEYYTEAVHDSQPHDPPRALVRVDTQRFIERQGAATHTARRHRRKSQTKVKEVEGKTDYERDFARKN